MNGTAKVNKMLLRLLCDMQNSLPFICFVLTPLCAWKYILYLQGIHNMKIISQHQFFIKYYVNVFLKYQVCSTEFFLHENPKNNQFLARTTQQCSLITCAINSFHVKKIMMVSKIDIITLQGSVDAYQERQLN